MAYGNLAALYGNLSESDQARDYAQKAFSLRERVSEREKLYLSFHYYDKVTGEIERQIQTLELWKQTYPRDWYAYTALGSVYQDVS